MGRIAIALFSLVTLVVWLSSPGRPVLLAGAPPAATKWEYKVLRMYDLQKIVKDDEKLAKEAQLLFERKVAEAKAANANGIQMAALQNYGASGGFQAEIALNKLGNDAWELTAVGPSGEYYLKRPRSVAVDPPSKDPTALEMAKLQGSWENKSRMVEYSFKGNAFTVLIGGEPAIKGTYKLDVTKTPKRIDFTIDYLVGDPKSKGKVSPCIYELDGAGFRLCQRNGNATEAPKTFDIDPKDGVTSYYKRVKS